MDIVESSQGSLIGTWRRFGAFGPTYEIIALGQPDDDQEPRYVVKLPDSGEHALYRLDQILDDPEAP